MDDLVRDRREVVPGERLLLRQELVQDDAKREEIAAPVHDLAGHLLGRHVVRRPEELPRRRQTRAVDLRDPEVRDLHGAVVREDDVRRLHVAMHDAPAVRVVEGVPDARHDLGDPVVRKRHLVLQDLLEVLALDVLHRDEGRPGLHLLSDVVNRHDVRVGQCSRRLRLPEEALRELAGLRIVLAVGPDRLQRDAPADDRIASEEHDAHRALAKLALDLVTSELSGQVGRNRIGRQTTSMPAPSRR